MRPHRIPLFPLNVVLFPGADLPLHIFEPRYRRMVNDCLQNDSQFGMLLSLPNGIAGIGCTAEILEVTNRYQDGRMDILTIGREPFRIVELDEQDPLLYGVVDYLEDRSETVTTRLSTSLTELYETCHTLIFGDYPKEAEIALNQDLSYMIADKLPMDLLWKQRILELRTETDRQERLLAYLREWAPHLQKLESARSNTASNGNRVN